MSPRTACTAIALALLGAGTAMPPPLRAQALAPMVGASAIQGSLQSIPASGAAGSLERGRNARGQIEAVNQEKQGAIESLSAPAPSGPANGASNGSGTANGPAGAGRSPASPQAPAGSTRLARVNGRTIPTCSHGGLCHRALLQAIGAGR